MIATRPPYDVFYRRSGQAMNILSRDHLLSDSYSSSSYSSKRDTPELEVKPGGPPRKRVPVACERCRKRKIKCSGDQGDGTGCDNCKSAGWEGCQFLRVRSVEWQCHPQLSGSRALNHHQHHYHPYSTSSRNRHLQYLQHSHYYPHHNQTSYHSWPSTHDYSGVSDTTTTVPWNQSNYASAYPSYEAENTNPYASNLPSYMLPDIAHSTRASYVSSMARPQQNSLWLEQMNSASVQHHDSNMYPLAPGGSTKSYPMLGAQSGQHGLSYRERLPALSGTLAALPSHEHDETPPLSAVSHRSSHTWETSTASHTSTASSRTSCGGSQDLTSPQGLATCDDQAAAYAYSAASTSPQISVPPSALPIATDGTELLHSTPTASDTGASTLHTQFSRDSLRPTSPLNAELYGYPVVRSSTRRSHGMRTTRVPTNSFGGTWNLSPSSISRNNSLQQPVGSGTEQYAEHRDSTGTLSTASTY